MKPAAPAGRIVPCPTCGQDAVYAGSNPWRPFCSQRCRNVDLGAWASEGYRVAAQAPTEDPDGDPPPARH
jgi:endogenous inhibitor of DNA gyrase (YacG/DUF329 family)